MIVYKFISRFSNAPLKGLVVKETPKLFIVREYWRMNKGFSSCCTQWKKSDCFPDLASVTEEYKRRVKSELDAMKHNVTKLESELANIPEWVKKEIEFLTK